MATPGTTEYPAAIDTAVSLIEAGNNAATTLDTAADSSDAILTVDSTATFPATGALTIEGEVIYYTGKSGTTFTLANKMVTVNGAHPGAQNFIGS